MNTIKQERIKELNSEILFNSRKMFGMHGNIQWRVIDIIDKTIIVSISSSTKGWGEIRPDGHIRPSKKQIACNIEKSIKNTLPNVEVKATWKEWRPEDGFGFMVSAHGMTAEELADKVMKIKESMSLEK